MVAILDSKTRARLYYIFMNSDICVISDAKQDVNDHFYVIILMFVVYHTLHL